MEVGQNEACADVDIQEDDQPEGRETFFVQTNVVGDLPGIVPEDSDPVMLIISDETGKTVTKNHLSLPPSIIVVC